MQPSKTRRPDPHHRSPAHIENKQRQSTRRAAEIVVGGALGILLALVVVSWLDWSLGTDPGHVERVAEVAR